MQKIVPFTPLSCSQGKLLVAELPELFGSVRQADATAAGQIGHAPRVRGRKRQNLQQESAYTQNQSLRAFNVRRSSAFILVLLHLLYDSTKPAAHGIASLICNFQHTGMAVFHGLDPGCHISDAAYSKYFHTHIIAERIRDNIHELAKTGRWLGGTTPTGYASESVKSITVDGKTKKACKLKLLPDEAEIIYKIFDLYEQYDSLTMTETELLRQGVKTKTGRSFTRFSIKSILQNPVYLIADKNAYPYFVDNEAELFAPDSDFDSVPARSQEKRQALLHKLQ